MSGHIQEELYLEDGMKPNNAGNGGYNMARGGHPLGVQPLGNLLFAQSPNATRKRARRGQGATESNGVGQHQCRNSRDRGLGSLAVLPDQLVLEVLGNLSARDLCRVGLCSRALWVFSHNNDFWRTVTLEDFGGDVEFERDWRTTYLMAKSSKGGDKMSTTASFSLKVNDFYSDYLFQGWLCASLSPHPTWLQVDNLPRVPVSSVTPSSFASRFERGRKPVILTGALDSWPALSRWQDKAYLIRAAADAEFAVGPVEMTLKRYLKYASTAVEERPLYIFDPKWAESAPLLEADYAVPELFREDLFSVLEADGGRRGIWRLREDTAAAMRRTSAAGSATAGAPKGTGEAEGLPEGGRPHHRWLIVGPAMSGSNWHIDPNSTCAWNAVVTGAKKWILLDPEEGPPPGVHPNEEGTDVAAPVSLVEWFMNFYGPLKKSGRRVWEGVCKAGEVVFVPHGWWHCVLNLEESVAITQNYVSRFNLLSVLRFLEKPQASLLVSGVPEKERESLGSRFKARLEHFYPGILELAAKDEKEKQDKLNGRASFWERATDNSKEQFTFGF